MSEINKISQKLLAEGWTQEQTPPGMKPWNWFYGGWTYKWDSRQDVVFESPCGLLWKRSEVSYSGCMSFMGINWTEENDNIATLCPYYSRKERCEKNHPYLEDRPMGGCHYEHLSFCAIHETDKPWEYEKSAERVRDLAEQLKEKRWNDFAKSRNGRVCRHHSHYNRNTGEWSMCYDPTRCLTYQCAWCSVLGKEISTKRGNVFYDVKINWTIHGEGLYPDEKKTSITKGIKLLDRPCSMTLCEAIAKVGKKDIQERERMRHHQDLFFGRIDSVEVLNVRAEKKAGRDIFQDLQDIEEGFEIHHAADYLAAAAAAKKAHRADLREKNRKAQEKILRDTGWKALSTFEKRKVRKYLTLEEIRSIEKERESAKDIGQISLDGF